MGQERKPPRGTAKLRERAEASLRPKASELHELSPDEIRALVHELQARQIELER